MPRVAAPMLPLPRRAALLGLFWQDRSEPEGQAGAALAQTFARAQEHLQDAARFWSAQSDDTELEDYVSPAAKRTFRFTVNFRLEGRVRPAPYELTEEDLDDLEA